MCGQLIESTGAIPCSGVQRAKHLLVWSPEGEAPLVHGNQTSYDSLLADGCELIEVLGNHTSYDSALAKGIWIKKREDRLV